MTQAQRIILAVAVPIAAGLIYWAVGIPAIQQPGDAPIFLLVLLAATTAIELWIWRKR